MLERLKRPTDPYDPAWVDYRAQNPGLRLSLSAADPGEDGGEGGDDIDLGAFVPESFKGEDGQWDTEGFRASYDELLAEKTQRDERIADLPEKPEDYAFALPEDFQLPEGFDAEAFKTKDADGNDVEFDPASMIDSEDPDIPLAQALFHKIDRGEITGSEAMSQLASIMFGREIRGMQALQAQAAEQRKALGPNADARISTVERALKANLKPELAKAVLDGVTSADALRGLESIIHKSATSTPPAPGGKNLADMSIDERLAHGLRERAKSA